MLTAENEMECCLNSPTQTGDVLRLCSTSQYICCRHYPAVVSTLLQFIVSYNELNLHF